MVLYSNKNKNKETMLISKSKGARRIGVAIDVGGSFQKVSLSVWIIIPFYTLSRIRYQTNDHQVEVSMPMHTVLTSFTTTMARSKEKKTPSKGKQKTTREESQADEISSNNLGPLTGVAALVILIVAIFLRPSSNDTTLFQSEAIVEKWLWIYPKKF